MIGRLARGFIRPPVELWLSTSAEGPVRAAFEGLARYKLRTALSVLGIVLGIAAVVAMVAISLGARAEAIRQISALGLQNVLLRYRPPENRRVGARGLTVGDLQRLSHLSPDIAFLSPLIERQQTVSGPSGRRDAPALAVSEAFTRIMELPVLHGRTLNTSDEATAARVCLLGARLGRDLFAADEPVGNLITIGHEPYRVIGVLRNRRAESRAVGAISQRAFDDAVFVPLSAFVGHPIASDRWQYVDEIWVRARDTVNTTSVGAAINRALTIGRPVSDESDYDVVVPRELLNERLHLQRTFDVVVGSIAALTLLVAGAGIMNVMLTAVLERTAEIGLRRAVGATRRSIAIQFLAESLVISLAGGGAGLVVGVIAAVGISRFAGWPTVVSAAAAIVAVLVSSAVGLLSGIYPAHRAASLSPIEAVRFE